jgi:hypothetical protein
MQCLAQAPQPSLKGVFAMSIGQLSRVVYGIRRRAALSAGPGSHRLRRCALAVIILSGGLAVWPSSEALGQTPSTVDTFRVVGVNAAPADTFFLDVYIRNVDTLGGFTFRIRFDPSVIEPLTDTIDDGGNLTITLESVQSLRGGIIPNGIWDTYGAGVVESGVLTLLAVDFQEPGVFFLPGGGVEVRMAWLVNASAPAQSTSILFENDPVFPQSFNTMSDYRAVIFKRPTLVGGTVNITTDGDGAPVIACPSPVTVGQGQLVQFSVTATDPNGDDLSLRASLLPEGATFTPSNPVTGNTSVTGTFQWIPSQAGDFTVSFRATDSPDGFSSPFCNVTITVQPGPVGNAPVVNCQVSTVTVDQGQLVEFTVSATDVDNDSITLTALTLPPGATFSPSNPIEGLGPLTGTFSWTPSFSQSGAFTVTFQALDTTGLSGGCNTTIFVNEVEVDQLFTTSAPGQKVQGGVSGTKDVVVPVDPVASQEVYGVQFDFIYDPVVFTPTEVQASDRLNGFQIYENLGEEPGRIRIVTFDLDGLPIGSGGSSVLFNIIGNINPGLTPGFYDVTFEDAWESISPDPDDPSLPLATTDGVIAVDNLGDANLDTRIDVGDVVAVIGYILSKFSFDLRQFVAGDVNADALLDVFDLQGIINLIFGLPVGPTPDQPGTGTPAQVDFVYDADDGPFGSYRLSANAPVDIAGAQVVLTYDASRVGLAGPETVNASSEFDITYRDDGLGHMVALLIDPSNDSRIPAGRSDLLRIRLTRASESRPVVRLRDVKLAAGDAAKIEVAGDDPVPKNFALYQNYPNPFNPSTTIAFAIGGNSAGSARVRLDIYNVLGQRITTLVEANLEPGRYEYQWNGTDRSGRSVASGLYFYRLMADRQHETKKMVLLK